MKDTLAHDVAAVSKIDAVPLILEVVCRTTGMGFAAVARVTEDCWIACAVRDEIEFGLKPGGELQVETTICSEIRDTGEPVIIDHVAKDESFCGHPTPKMYGFQSYISLPIYRRDGRFFGTLCAIDPRPARLNAPQVIGMFRLFADLIGLHLDVQDRLAISEKALLDERQKAELREQFIAVLGHDLRNPLASIETGTRMLLRMPLSEKATSVVVLMQNSAKRMARLIDNVLDFARARLGDGFPINLVSDAELITTIEQVVAELQTAWPDRIIRSELTVDRPVACDSTRIGQLLSNLLGNALTHGDRTGAIRVYARSDANWFELSVANKGEPIAAEALHRLFQPFWRATARPGQQGLGLGLYIASKIARAHAGKLEVASTPEETRFTFRMPVAGPV